MSDYASLLATIAGLQEQVNTMNGQLNEVRPFFICSCPFLRARCGRGGPPRPAAPPPPRPRPLHTTTGAAIHALSRAPRPPRPRARRSTSPWASGPRRRRVADGARRRRRPRVPVLAGERVRAAPRGQRPPVPRRHGVRRRRDRRAPGLFASTAGVMLVTIQARGQGLHY